MASLGDKVAPGDAVTLSGEPVEPLKPENVVVIALNKPRGLICTAAPHVKDNIVSFVGYPSRIYPIGRLDKDSQGLIFLTNKSGLVDQINQSGLAYEKEYRVTVHQAITDEFLEGLCGGVSILGQTTRPCLAVQESDYIFRIVLTQGLNRQIRRMCQHFGFRVLKLERIRIMHVCLNDLGTGQWRDLTHDELVPLLNESN